VGPRRQGVLRHEDAVRADRRPRDRVQAENALRYAPTLGARPYALCTLPLDEGPRRAASRCPVAAVFVPIFSPFLYFAPGVGDDSAETLRSSAVRFPDALRPHAGTRFASAAPADQDQAQEVGQDERHERYGQDKDQPGRGRAAAAGQEEPRRNQQCQGEVEADEEAANNLFGRCEAQAARPTMTPAMDRSEGWRERR
jgi:hypothetical protein